MIYEFYELMVIYGYKLIVIYGQLVAVAVLTIIIILVLAHFGAYFMNIAQGTTAFIRAGDSLKAVLPNIGGYMMSASQDLDGRHWLIPEENEERRMESLFYNSLPGTKWFQKWLWKTFGVKFISIVWPQTKRHTFDIRSRKRLLEGADVAEGTPLKARVVDSLTKDGTKDSTIVDSLLFLVPRPVYLDGIQLAGDNSRINLLLLPIYRQIIPVLPVFYLKGDFFTQLDAAIESAVVDFFATYRVKEEGEQEEPLSYAHWLKLAKSGGNSPLEIHLRRLNVSRKYRDNLRETGRSQLIEYIDKLIPELAEEADEAGKTISSGIIPRFGFALVSFRIVDWEPHKDTANLAKALLTKETERHTADGVRQKAFGERDAILARAAGESSRYTQLVDALVGKGVTADVAAGVVQTQLRTENIGGKDSKVVTYVEGGASTGVMVSGK